MASWRQAYHSAKAGVPSEACSAHRNHGCFAVLTPSPWIPAGATKEYTPPRRKMTEGPHLAELFQAARRLDGEALQHEEEAAAVRHEARGCYK